MPVRPTVTIVTPSYNQGSFLEETLLSVLTQDYPNIEYLVIDGGSTDGSVEIIKKYEGRLAFWVSEPDQGQAHAINKGFRRARGEILGWLNSDDLYCPGAVRTAVEFLESHPDVSVVYGRADLIDSEGTVLGSVPPEDFDPAVCIARQRFPIPQPATFFRRETLQQVGDLDQRLRYCLDWDYWIRIALAELKIAGIPQILARCRLHGRSKTVSELIAPKVEMVEWLDRFFSRSLPRRVAVVERQARSRALFSLARQYYYAADVARARRTVLRAAWGCPANLLRDRAAWLLAMSLLPNALIREVVRLRKRWCAPSAAANARHTPGCLSGGLGRG
jgi:glycosyltransferase involved in cell wall biosynthesis